MSRMLCDDRCREWADPSGKVRRLPGGPSCLADDIFPPDRRRGLALNAIPVGPPGVR